MDSPCYRKLLPNSISMMSLAKQLLIAHPTMVSLNSGLVLPELIASPSPFRNSVSPSLQLGSNPTKVF